MNERLRGVSRMESLEIILENYRGTPLSQADKEKLAEEKNTIYRASLSRMSPQDLSPEVRETLKQLRVRGIKLAIGSSSKNTKYILKQIGLEHFFDAVSDGTNISHSKPDPEVFIKAAEYLGESPKDCLVVEDARSGIDAAVSGGFDSAGIGTAASYSKAVYVIHDFSDLLHIVE